MRSSRYRLRLLVSYILRITEVSQRGGFATGSGARNLACRVHNRVNAWAAVHQNQASARVPTRHAGVRAPRRNIDSCSVVQASEDAEKRPRRLLRIVSDFFFAIRGVLAGPSEPRNPGSPLVLMLVPSRAPDSSFVLCCKLLLQTRTSSRPDFVRENAFSFARPLA